ncbi:hypothetical protein [Paracoccus onubensis]|nr:hypothetical protein [Paracoccus onubensis]
MADKNLLFSGPMVRALLDGRKTQTRRVLKLPTKTHNDGPIYEHPKMGGWAAGTIGGKGCYLDPAKTIPAPERTCIWHQTTGTTMLPSYAPGDRLWVREAFSYDSLDVDREGVLPPWYWADGNPSSGDFTRPKPSIHMPRWASRLTLIVTDVRVQRLQEINEADAVAEGIEGDGQGAWRCYLPEPKNQTHWSCPRESFRTLWDSLNAKRGYGWDVNPWVCAVTFTVHRMNIDQMEAA